MSKIQNAEWTKEKKQNKSEKRDKIKLLLKFAREFHIMVSIKNNISALTHTHIHLQVYEQKFLKYNDGQAKWKYLWLDFFLSILYNRQIDY